MSEINEFARDLVKRQIQIYKDHKSSEFDMTQPLSVLICCSIIIFSDYEKMYNSDSLIKEMYGQKKDEWMKLINQIYPKSSFETRLSIYATDRKENKKSDYLNKDYKELEVFFHDLRNEFAHLIEDKKTETLPVNEDGCFKQIQIKIPKKSTKITINISKEKIIEIIKLIDNSISKKSL